MILQHLKLNNFRNFTNISFDFDPILTIIIGENAKGKTNLLEALYFLITGYGFREMKEEELLCFEKEGGFVEGEWIDDGKKREFKIALTKENSHINKTFFIEKAKKTASSYHKEQMRAVLFAPDQISMIDGSPSLRREYINHVLSLGDLEYKRRLSNYESALRRRNKILERSSEYRGIDDEIEYWNTYLIEQSSAITKKREEYMCFLNEHPDVDGKKFSIQYLKNEFSQERIISHKDVEMRVKKTLIGPQRDDGVISLIADRSKNIHHFGSRSEQRLAVFWLKINELLYYETIFQRKPILLLDDVFSELDLHNKKLILHLIGKYQTVITTTEEETVQEMKGKHSIIRL